jgi:hypothetical protein
MFIFKLGLLTCAFYVVLTILLEAGLWAVANSKGFGVFFSYRHLFWTLGIKLGAIFGALWCISFSAAWYIVYLGLKARMPTISN